MDSTNYSIQFLRCLRQLKYLFYKSKIGGKKHTEWKSVITFYAKALWKRHPGKEAQPPKRRLPVWTQKCPAKQLQRTLGRTRTTSVHGRPRAVRVGPPLAEAVVVAMLGRNCIVIGTFQRAKPSRTAPVSAWSVKSKTVSSGECNSQSAAESTALSGERLSRVRLAASWPMFGSELSRAAESAQLGGYKTLFNPQMQCPP